MKTAIERAQQTAENMAFIAGFQEIMTAIDKAEDILTQTIWEELLKETFNHDMVGEA